MSGSSDALPDPRASDADRERAVEVLRRAASDGQLTVDELEERVSSAYAPRTVEELQRLTAGRKPTKEERRRERQLRKARRR